ncbi:MAG: cation diffusion facilitator family transporter [Proteobacteria bacterium]|nr:cation diffusion facilitator family transporter [Pseudomonadota bacterium]
MNALQIASILSLVLAIAKGSAFAMSGSLVVLASFLDSSMDAALSWINFKMSRAAKADADKEHPYGHGGFEVISSLLQGFLIGGSGVLVVFQIFDRIFSPAGYQNTKMEEIPFALGVLVISTMGGGFISWFLGRSRTKLSDSGIRSLSLEADHAHYRGDLAQSFIGILGMALTIWQQNPLFDVLASGISGAILLRTAYPLIRNSLKDVMNTEFDHKIQSQVQNIVLNSKIPEIKGLHRLRSRTLGPNHFVDFHLKLPNEIQLINAHNIAYELEALIKGAVANVDVMIHLDPESEPDDDF